MSVTAENLVDWQLRMGWTQKIASSHLGTPLKTYQKWAQGTARVPGAIAVLTRYIETIGVIF